MGLPWWVPPSDRGNATGPAQASGSSAMPLPLASRSPSNVVVVPADTGRTQTRVQAASADCGSARTAPALRLVTAARTLGASPAGEDRVVSTRSLPVTAQ